MEYLDFSSVITTIRNYISDAHSMNQIDMMYQLFVSFLSSDESLDFDFDNGLVCRWFNGQAKISPRITRYYMDNHNRNRLAADMHRIVHLQQKKLSTCLHNLINLQMIYCLLNT